MQGWRLFSNPWGADPSWAPGGADWVWFTFAGVVGLLAAVMFGLMILWGRSRGRLRCPGCWYDMAGAAAPIGAPFPVTCPECGKRITMARKLRRARVRWRVVSACALLALVAAASGMLPWIRRAGIGPLVASLTPTFVLVQIDDGTNFADQWGALPLEAFVERELEARDRRGEIDARVIRRWFNRSGIADQRLTATVTEYEKELRMAPHASLPVLSGYTGYTPFHEWRITLWVHAPRVSSQEISRVYRDAWGGSYLLPDDDRRERACAEVDEFVASASLDPKPCEVRVMGAVAYDTCWTGVWNERYYLLLSGEQEIEVSVVARATHSETGEVVELGAFVLPVDVVESNDGW